MSIPTIIEIALLLVVVFLIGCIIGWFLRTKMFRSPVVAQSGSSSTKPTSAPPPSARQMAPRQTAESASKEAPEPAPKQAPESAPKSAPLPKSASPAKPRPAAVSQPEKVQKEAEQPAPSVPEPDSENAARPQSLSAPRKGGKDDLKKIKGIGPKLESRLNEMGIYHFDQIAGWKRETIDWVDEHLSFKGRIDRDQWISQAKDLSEKQAQP